jgi:hypothetical protein
MNDWAFIDWDLLSPDDHSILLNFPIRLHWAGDAAFGRL